MTPVWAVIPTNGRHVFGEALRNASEQCDKVIVVANNGFEMDSTPPVEVITTSEPTNIHVWWNLGLDTAPPDAHVLVINDDCILGHGAVETLASALDRTGAELAYPDLGDGGTRITGWCWMRQAGSRLRADEEFGWWAGDNDLHWRATAHTAVRGVHVDHRFPNYFTVTRPELSAQAGRDVERFKTKWGKLPY